MFSDAFSEGQSRDINEGFPSNSSTIEVYDYLSDSDLEDECLCSEEEDAESTEGDNPESQDGNRLASVPPGPCKLFG